MPTYRHTDRGTVITTTADPGPGWELADSPSTPDDKAPGADKAPAKKSTRARKAAGATTKE